MTNIETLEQIINDFIEQNDVSVGDLIDLFESVKFKLLYRIETEENKE